MTYTCPICSKTYSSVSDVQRCVNACSEKAKANEEAVKRKADALENERLAKQKEIQELLDRINKLIDEATDKMLEYNCKYTDNNVSGGLMEAILKTLDDAVIRF